MDKQENNQKIITIEELSKALEDIQNEMKLGKSLDQIKKSHELNEFHEAFFEQLCRENNTISYSLDKSVTQTTLSISMARDLNQSNDGSDDQSLNLLKKAKLQEEDTDGVAERVQNLFENSALQYENLQYPQSLESTFIGAGNSGILKQPELPKQLFGAPSFFMNPAGLNSYVLNNFIEEECEGEPVLGLDLQDYFSKRHLADFPPIEPMPPIENPLEMTQNNEDWIRHREDIKIEHEKNIKLQETFQNLSLADKSDILIDQSDWDVKNAFGISEKVRSTVDQVKINNESTQNDCIPEMEGFIQQSELRQLLDLEQSLFKMLKNPNFSPFKLPCKSPPPEEDFEPAEPISQATIGGSLQNLQHFLIKSDMKRCVLCNQEYSDVDSGNGGNLPRVLYCGDTMCETCIVKQIQKASITDKSNLNIAACQVTCPICCVKHVFKLTMQGFLICNDKYIKVQDERGPVNFFPGQKSASMLQGDFTQIFSKIQHMNQSISIPYSLVLRSLPINVELLQLISRPNLDFSMLSDISQASDSLNKREFKVQQKSMISKASVPSSLEKRKDIQRKKVIGSNRAQFKSQQKQVATKKHKDQNNLLLKGDSMSSDSDQPQMQNQQPQNDNNLSTESEIEAEDIKFCDADVEVRKPQKKKKNKKISRAKYLQNLTRGVQIQDEDLFTWNVPQNLEVFEATEISGRSILQTKTQMYDHFDPPPEQVQFEDKFHLIQTLKNGSYQNNTPLTCYQCSGTIPIRASKYYQTREEYDEDSDSPRMEAYQKPQHTLIKELVEAGIVSVCTHYCLNCYENPLLIWCKTYNKDEDFSFMCLMCAIKHKREMPQHYFQSLYQPMQIQATLKKSEIYQQLVREELQMLMANKVQDELTVFCEQILQTCDQAPKKKKKK